MRRARANKYIEIAQNSNSWFAFFLYFDRSIWAKQKSHAALNHRTGYMFLALFCLILFYFRLVSFVIEILTVWSWSYISMRQSQSNFNDNIHHRNSIRKWFFFFFFFVKWKSTYAYSIFHWKNWNVPMRKYHVLVPLYHASEWYSLDLLSFLS